jgi:hypothetical protein
MLGTLLDQIPGSLSRRFLLGNFLPLALFCIGSLALGYTCSTEVQGFATWFDRRPTLVQGFLGTATTLGLAALALALSGLSTLGRLALEGSFLPAGWLKKFADRHSNELDKASESLEILRSDRHNMIEYRAKAIDQLSAARSDGVKIDPPKCCYPLPGSTIQQTIAAKPSSLADLRALVDALTPILGSNHVGAPCPDARRLDADHEHLVALLDERLRILTNEYRRSTVAMERCYPGGKVYATRFARVAGSLGAYAERRYGADYAVLWPRLEAVARKEEPELWDALQDASARLDFHIAMFWMTTAFVVTWTIALACVGINVWLYLLIAFGGPILCCAWYELGVRSYSALADQAKAAVDLLRLKVFDALGVARPHNPDEERKNWIDLGSSLAFGGSHDVPYENQAPAPTGAKEHRVHLYLEPAPPPASGPAADS